jgi:hypothetical protein
MEFIDGRNNSRLGDSMFGQHLTRAVDVTGYRPRRSRGLRIWVWGVVVAAALSLCAQELRAGDRVVLDSATVNYLHSIYCWGMDVWSIVAFRFIDQRGDSLMDSVGVRSSEPRYRGTLPVDLLKGAWYPAGTCSYDISLPGYRPIRLSDVRIPFDSIVMITVRMQHGDDSIPDSVARARFVNIVYDSISDALRWNVLSGTVLDEERGTPVESAHVYCEQVRQGTFTDSLGRFAVHLDTATHIAFHVWHAEYDSIRYELDKDCAHSEYKVAVHFERRRGPTGSRLARFSDSTALILLGLIRHASLWDRTRFEATCALYTRAVRVGDPFGPISRWPMTSCLPFRLIRTFPDTHALVQCIDDLFPHRISGNFAILSDSGTEFREKALDGSGTMTLQILPDYLFPNVDMSKVHDQQIDVPTEPLISVVDMPDSCNVVRATVERTHMLNVIYLLNGDYDNLAQAFGPEFHAPANHYEPTAENFRQHLSPSQAKYFTSWKFENFVFPYEFEVCIYGDCGQSTYDRYLLIMEEAGLKPEIGDVYVCFPHATVCPWGDRQAAVYRLYNGKWKIITWG